MKLILFKGIQLNCKYYILSWIFYYIYLTQVWTFFLFDVKFPLLTSYIKFKMPNLKTIGTFPVFFKLNTETMHYVGFTVMQCIEVPIFKLNYRYCPIFIWKWNNLVKNKQTPRLIVFVLLTCCSIFSFDVNEPLFQSEREETLQIKMFSLVGTFSYKNK